MLNQTLIARRSREQDHASDRRTALDIGVRRGRFGEGEGPIDSHLHGSLGGGLVADDVRGISPRTAG